MKIAIVGAGVSGLVVAYHLHRHHEITVFEAGDHAGGHAHTVDVEAAGRTYAVDTGFVVYNERNYPNFTQLLRELDVRSRPTTMSFSVSDRESDLEYNGHSLNTLFAQRRNLLRPRFWRLVADILRFHRQASHAGGVSADRGTVRDFLRRGRYSSAFQRLHLLPMGAAIWSCAEHDFGEFPWRFVREFYANHGLLQLRDRPTWRVIEGGSRTYVEALTREFRDRIRLRARVAAVRRLPDRVELITAQRPVEAFDHVVFACHADQALRTLGDEATRVERQVLGAFPYRRNTALLHTDERLLPRRRRAWASWNYRLRGEGAGPPCVTYNMNRLQGFDAPRTFCITLNAEDEVEPGAILGRFVYEHPVYTIDRLMAQPRRCELLVRHRTSYCGAYWGSGFHEDGVVSALEVVRAIESMPQARMPHAREIAPVRGPA